MASTIVNMQLPTGQSGLTITLYPGGSDTAGNTPDTLTEATNRLGLYSATVTEALSGIHYVKVLNGSVLYATGWVDLADDTSTYQVIDQYPQDIIISAAVWDRVVSAANHNLAGSAGRRLRQISAVPMIEGTINDASPTSTSFATTLTGYTDSSLSDALLMVEHDSDKWEAKAVASYTSSTGTFTFDEAFSATLADGDNIAVQITHIHPVSKITSDIDANSTALATIDSNINTLLTRITSTLFSGITSFSEWLGALAGKQTGDSTARTEIRATGAGSGTFDETSDSLEALRDRGDSAWVTGSNSGSGARVVTITVDDGTDPLENATVRMSEGVNTHTDSTNASGVATFNLDDATYTVSISKTGYTYGGTTLVVDGTESETYSMTALSITPSANADMTTAYFTARDINGDALASETFTYQQITNVSGDGNAFEADSGTATADGTGLVQIAMYKGASYTIMRGSGETLTVSIASGAGSTTELSNMLI